MTKQAAKIKWRRSKDEDEDLRRYRAAAMRHFKTLEAYGAYLNEVFPDQKTTSKKPGKTAAVPCSRRRKVILTHA